MDMRLDKINAIELVFLYDVRNVFIFNHSLWLILGELSCLLQLFIFGAFSCYEILAFNEMNL